MRKKVRDLNKYCRQLQKQLKHYTKKDHFHDGVRDEVEELMAAKEAVHEKEEQRVPCLECNEGFYDDILDIMDKLYGTCTSCGHRKRFK